MSEPRTKEWPLVVFTVGLQISAGIAIVNAAESWLSPTPAKFAFVQALSMLLIVSLAMLASLFHIGRPLAFWRALSNYRQSRLSKEVVFCALFALLAFLEFAIGWEHGSSSVVLNIATAIAGVTAVVTSIRIYSIPAQPLWNSSWLPSSFLGSTLLFAGVIAELGNSLPDRTRLISAQLLIAIGATLLLISTVAMVFGIQRIARAHYSAPEAVPVMQTRQWISIGSSIVLGSLVPLVGAVLSSTPANHSTAFAVILAVLTVIGVTLGRGVMFSRGIALSRF